MLRLVPKPVQTFFARAGEAYFKLLVGLLVLIAGSLVLVIAMTLLGI